MLNKNTHPMLNLVRTELSGQEPDVIDAAFLSVIKSPEDETQHLFGPVLVTANENESGEVESVSIYTRSLDLIPHIKERMNIFVEAISSSQMTSIKLQGDEVPYQVTTVDTLAASMLEKRGLSFKTLASASSMSPIFHELFYNMVTGIVEQTENSVYTYYPEDSKSGEVSLITALLALDEDEISEISPMVIDYISLREKVRHPSFANKSQNKQISLLDKYHETRKNLFENINSNSKIVNYVDSITSVTDEGVIYTPSVSHWQ